MFDAYKVAVKLSLVNGVSAGLAGLALQFQRLNKDVDKTQNSLFGIKKQMLEIKRLGMVGGAMAIAGGFGLSLFKGPVEAASEYERAYTRFKTLNLGELANKQADHFARAAQRFGTSSTDMMDALHASVGLMGGMKNATAVAPMLAELNAANGVLFGGKIQALDSGSVGAIMRFNDMRGLTDSPSDFKRGLNLAQRMVTGSGGMIKFTDLQQMAKRGGAAFKGLSDDGVLMLASIMQEQGGNATGTGLMSMYQNLIAGRTTKKAMAKLSDAGLARLGYVSHGMVGGKEYKTLQVTDIIDAKMMRENPGMWLMKYAAPAAKKAGAKSQSEVVAFINDLLSNRTGSNMGAAFTTQQFQAMRDFNLAKNAMGVDQTIDAAKDTNAGKFADMTKRWKDLMIEVGIMVLPTVNRSLENMIGILKAVKGFATDFPVLAKGLVFSFGILSLLIGAGGLVMLSAAAFKSLGLAFAIGGGKAGLAGMVTETASSIAIFGKVIGVVGGVVAAWMAGQEVGGWINNHLSGDTKNTIGRVIASLLSTVGVKNAQDAIDSENRYIRTQKQSGGKQGNVYLDGKHVGVILAPHISNEQARAASKPQAGSSRFDGRMTPAHVGASGGW